MKRSGPLCLLAGVLAAHQADASLIAVGLPWKDVFVQEYWKDGAPRYAIANFRKEDIVVSVCAGREQEGLKPLAGPWKVKAGAIVHVDAPKGQTGLLSVVLGDGKSLGLISAPQSGQGQPKEKYVSYDGLNGSGGRHTDLWCEQDALTVKSGGVIELTLKLPANAGILKYTKVKEERNPAIAVSKATVKEAVSETALITADDKSITIDTKKPAKPAPMHTVTVRFEAPKVAEPMMVYVDGWLAKSEGSGHGMTRGVVVVP
jgi:hypothetical protein